MNVVVSASEICKTFEVGDLRIEVLNGVNLEVEKGEFVTIIGPSGSGKTTLLNIIGGIDKPTKGRIIVFGEDLNVKDEDFKQCRFPDSAKSSQFLENPTHFHLIFHSNAGFWSQTGFEFDEG